MEQVEDIQNAITFLQQQDQVDSGHIGLFGAATGGAHASYIAGIDDRVRCIASVNGMGDFERWMKDIRRYWEWIELKKIIREDRLARVVSGKSRLVATKEVIIHDPVTAKRAIEEEKQGRLPLKRFISLESVEAMIGYKPEDAVHLISPRAAMWMCAKGDALVPNEQSLGMYEKAREPKRIEVFEGLTHHDLYLGPGFEQMMAAATEWFDTHLRENISGNR
jgi:hypothetical protein